MFTQRNHYGNVSESMSRAIFVIQQLWVVVLGCFFKSHCIKKMRLGWLTRILNIV